ncbi:MAG TPA: indolepyruvate oxidoreductase subunit beta family protein [Candidatus Acidoferrales bacterium]|nr:indolepyruvate oxidoreductase subunit beta family protein [Candidatus Acidoferrales bacterium]
MNSTLTTAAPNAAQESKAPAAKAITIAIVAMGGEGGGVLADWLVDLAEHSGYCAQNTSVPGVAQRTGATIYYIEIFPEAAAKAAGKEPVLALMPVPGELDIVLASELMEAGRAIQRGLVTPERTTLIASTNRVYSMTEKMAIADGQVNAAKLIEAGAASARRFVHGDFARIAEDTRSVISAPLFGALASTGALPFTRKEFEDAITRGGVGVESSLAAFAAGFAAASQPAAAPSVAEPAVAAKPKVGARLQALAGKIENEFPAASHDILFAGITRVADYQDEAYAADYLRWLGPIRDLDQQHGNGDYSLLRETGRYLALWMTYEDAIRVADLKIRRSRFDRVQKEVRASGEQLVRINEFLHPGPQEIADILPAGLGRWLLRSRAARGMIDKFTGPGKIVQTTSLSGFLQLYMLANLRPMRRKSLRFREEAGLIQAWLERVRSLAAEDYALALEVAECPQLLKGYGETHIRGTGSYNAVLGAIPRLRRTGDAAAGLRKLRETALADESGEKLSAMLNELPA